MNFADRMDAINRVQAGETVAAVARDYNIHHTAIRSLIRKYKKGGMDAVRDMRVRINSWSPGDPREEFVRMVVVNKQSQSQVARLAGVSQPTITQWITKFYEAGGKFSEPETKTTTPPQLPEQSDKPKKKRKYKPRNYYLPDISKIEVPKNEN